MNLANFSKMIEKVLQFIKYNNLTVLIILVFLIVGGTVMASETAQEALGQKQTRVEGVDNTALLTANLDNMDMDYKIENIAEDDKYYYVTYTHLDLENQNNAWQYQVQEKTR